MATKGIVQLFVGDAATHGGSNSWTPVTKIVDIKPNQISVDDIETSNMDSPEQYKEFDPGWKDAGEVNFTVQHQSAQHVSLLALLATPRGWKVQFADGSNWKLDAYIKSFQDTVEREKLTQTEMTLKVSGKPVFAAASGA